MPTITVWFDGIIEKWRTAGLEIGFDDNHCLYPNPNPETPRRFAEKGAVVFHRLTSLRGASLYMPTGHSDRTPNRVVVRKELLCHADGGFAPAMRKLMIQIARKLGECGLGDASIEYQISDDARHYVGPFAESTWPKTPGEHY